MNQAQALQKELDKIKHKHKLLSKLATTKGFIAYYYEQLKNHPSQKDTFHYINEMYHQMTGEYRYASFNSFRNVKNKTLR